MNDPRTSQSPGVPATPPEESLAANPSGMALRVDSAHDNLRTAEIHASPDSGSRSRVAVAKSAMVDSGAAETESADRPASLPLPASIELETAQITALLQTRYEELDRREQRLHVQIASLDQERRDIRMWAAELEATLADREAAITGQETALSQRAQSCLTLEAELKELRDSLLRERHNLADERDVLIRDREEDRRVLEELKRRQIQEIERERADLLAEQERLLTELRQERVQLENRARFQQNHLERAMRELESAQNAFRKEQQLGQTRLNELSSQNQMRSRQLDRQRLLLDARQQSFEREWHVLLKERRAVEERYRDEHDALRQQRAQWELDRETQRADLRRQHDMLTLHAEKLESRSQRLDQLRVELDETNCQTLEMRLAVDEAWAQLVGSSGSEAARQRVDEARGVLAEYYRSTRDALVKQRAEIEQAQSRMNQQYDEFRAERSALVAWIGERDAEMARRETDLVKQREGFQAREEEWQSLAHQWTRDRLEQESVIRNLLAQLAAREESAGSSTQA
jgi:DNA repair exonuclease SbcCD ATPase subunit